jgi:DnaJ-class molecular chaperone
MPHGCVKKLKVSIPSSDPTSYPWTSNKRPSKSTIYTIHVQPGWKAGTKIKFGPNPKEGIPPITFILREKPHAYLKRHNHNLIYSYTLSSQEAHQGGIHIHIPALPDGQGSLDFNIPKGDTRLPIHHGYNITIPNRGMYIRGGPKRGDLILQFRVVSSTVRNRNSNRRQE